MHKLEPTWRICDPFTPMACYASLLPSPIGAPALGGPNSLGHKWLTLPCGRLPSRLDLRLLAHSAISMALTIRRRAPEQLFQAQHVNQASRPVLSTAFLCLQDSGRLTHHTLRRAQWRLRSSFTRSAKRLASESSARPSSCTTSPPASKDLSTRRVPPPPAVQSPFRPVLVARQVPGPEAAFPSACLAARR